MKMSEITRGKKKTEDRLVLHFAGIHRARLEINETTRFMQIVESGFFFTRASRSSMSTLVLSVFSRYIHVTQSSLNTLSNKHL